MKHRLIFGQDGKNCRRAKPAFFGNFLLHKNVPYMNKPDQKQGHLFWKSNETGVNTIEKRVELSVYQGCNLKMTKKSRMRQ